MDSLTAHAFGSFVESATAQPGCVVVIDFAALTHLGFDQAARVLAGASPMIRKVLELTGYSEELNADLAPTGPESCLLYTSRCV